MNLNRTTVIFLNQFIGSVYTCGEPIVNHHAIALSLPWETHELKLHSFKTLNKIIQKL